MASKSNSVDLQTLMGLEGSEVIANKLRVLKNGKVYIAARLHGQDFVMTPEGLQHAAELNKGKPEKTESKSAKKAKPTSKK